MDPAQSTHPADHRQNIKNAKTQRHTELGFDNLVLDAYATATNTSSDATAEIPIVEREWVLNESPNEHLRNLPSKNLLPLCLGSGSDGLYKEWIYDHHRRGREVRLPVAGPGSMRIGRVCAK